MADIEWEIRREGRSWTRDEMASRWPLTPEKFEAIDGKIFWSDEDRLNLLAMLLENVGIDVAIGLAPPDVWRAALDAARPTPPPPQS
jgi:hypothetical protein